MQSRDHPVLLSVPEASSLKCLVFRRLDECVSAGLKGCGPPLVV